MKNQPVTPTPADQKPAPPADAPIKVRMIDLRRPGAFLPLLLSGGHDD